MGSADSFQSMKHLKTTGATWISIVVTQYQWRINSTTIFPLYNGSAVGDTTSRYYEFITLTTQEVQAAVRHAKSLGLKVMLKPHVDLLRDNKPLGRFWRGDIGGCPASWDPPPVGVIPFTAAEWDAWFTSYKAAFLPYAQLAEAELVEMLSMNCELYCPNQQESHWRSLVATTRQVYRGQLTVSQIAGHEQELKWWDAVDVIGIDAYYHLDGATVAELTGAWQPYVQLAEQLHRQYNRTVAFTEIGYCSGHCSRHHTPGGNDYERHAMHYQAVFEAFRAKSWFEGAFWWNWDTDPGAFARDDCLTPQWKPAEDILRRYYRATHPKPPRPTQPAQCIGDGKCTC